MSSESCSGFYKWIPDLKALLTRLHWQGSCWGNSHKMGDVFFMILLGLFSFQTLAKHHWLNLVIIPPAPYPSATARHWSQPLAASKSPVALFKVKVKELLPFQIYHLSKWNALLQLILFVTTGYRSAEGLHTGKLVDLSLNMAVSRHSKSPC